MILWQRCKHLCVKAIAQGKQPLLINLDETPVTVINERASGNLLRKDADPTRNQVRLWASQRDRRLHFTHVGVICNVPRFQKLLPQVIFVPEQHCSWSLFNELGSELPENVYIKRMMKGWANAQQHAIILEIIALTLAPYVNEYQPRISFDGAPAHMHASCFENWLKGICGSYL
jgi:hypothetical protein